MKNEIARISDRLHTLQGNGFEGKYIVYFHPVAGVRGEERESGKGPKLYNPEEFSRLALPPESQPDDRPVQIKEAQAAMEAAEVAFSKADEAWWSAKDKGLKLRRASRSTDRMGEHTYRNREGLENAEMLIHSELIQREAAGNKLSAARSQYNSLMKAWSDKKRMDEYAASMQKMQLQKLAAQEKRRKTLFGFLKGGNNHASN